METDSLKAEKPIKEPMVEDPDQDPTKPKGDASVTAETTIADLPDTEKIFTKANISSNDDDLEDVGWSHDHQAVPAPLIRKLPNDQLWLLIRRFDKQMFHVKAHPGPYPGGLDLTISDEEEFSPDKLRVNFERLYMTVIIGVAGFVKHIARLRSWHEKRRTTAFAVAYFIAWIFSAILPLLFTLLTVLIVVPQSRTFLFPPAPLALVSSKTGGLQKPKAGELGSADSLTGAAENHKGEAVEQEASNFVSGFASLAVGTVAGKGPENKGEQETEGEIDDSLPDPTAIAASTGDAKQKAEGGKTGAHDKTKEPVHDAMWTKARPIMRIISDISDGWERCGNALSPTPPFHPYAARMRLAAIVAPLILVTYFMKSQYVIKGVGFGIGFGFFGDPLITRGAHWLNTTFPHWQKMLELRNSVLYGVPTNAQLTLTLLRVAEENKAPIPPPPTSQAVPQADPNAPELEHDLPESAEAEPGSTETKTHDPTGGAPDPDKKDLPKKHGSRIARFFKGTAKAGVGATLGADRIRAVAGSEHAKQRLGALPGDVPTPTDGPVSFEGRFHGKKGLVLISTNATSPCVSFAKEDAKTGTEPVTSIALSDIKELKKLGGLGWKAKLVVGMALGVPIADGIEIVYGEKNERVRFMAMLRRDECFNRLIALNPKTKWESW